MLRKATQLFAYAFAFGWLMPLASVVQAEEPKRWATNMPVGVTSVSQQIYSIHMQVFWIAVVIGVLVFGVMFVSMFLHRKSRGVKAANFHESTTVELIWTIVPALILVWIAIPATGTLRHLYDTEEAEIDIKVTGYQWRWQYDYLGEGVAFMSDLSTSEDEIYGGADKGINYMLEVTEPLVIPVDTKVRFLLTANDVIHSFWVPEFGIKKDAIPGFINETWAKVTEPGIYRGACAELCGRGHAFMPIVVEVLPKGEYQAWLAEKQEEAETIRQLTQQQFTLEELQERGQQVHNRTCIACHGAGGQGVPGIFPALVGSPVVTGDLQENLDTVINGVPGTAMQAFGAQLSEVDIAAVITYQRNAWGNDTGDIVQPLDVLNFKLGQEGE